MRERRARRLLESFLLLGPTFIKLGQLLSSRPDVLPPEYVDTLSELQDRVPPAPWSDAKRVIEGELGPVDERFDLFETDAISGASLGQVYAATVDGTDVAVKVRRPDVEALVETDLRVIHWSLPILLPFVDPGRSYSLESLADEFGDVIHDEMDYNREAQMLEEIRGNFTEEPDVVMPTVLHSHSGERVLTMEYIDGIKITNTDALDAAGLDRREIAVTLQRAYLKMIIDDGVFHADPHPGNLAVRKDGTVVFYDFGMSDTVDETTQDTIVEFYVAVANQDIDGILDSLIALGTLSPDADRATMASVMELAIKDARGEQIETWRVNQIVERVEDTIYEFPLRLPSNLALVLRVATVVEGVCVTLDPDFDFIAVATQYLTEGGYREESLRQFLDETGTQVRLSAQSALRTPPKLERMLDRFDRNDFYVRADIEDSNGLVRQLGTQLTYAILAATGWITTGVLYAFTEGPVVYASAVLTVLFAVQLYRSFRARRGLRGGPQFTRQTMRERQRKE